MTELAAFSERCLGLPAVKFKRLTEAAKLPTRGTEYAAGLDLYAAEEIFVPGQSRQIVTTGLLIELPFGHEGQVRSRSGLAAKNGIHVLNAPGTIDEDYRGELKVVLMNTSVNDFHVRIGDRIAQLVVAPVSYNPAVMVDELSPAPTRGDKGFGSTGTR
jgi:dUTP pyrophosphatase